MKVFLLVFLVVAGSTSSQALSRIRASRSRHLPPPVVPKNTALPSAQWYTQTLDHFNPADTRTFQQKFYVNSDYYQEGGPVIIMIGGEGPASPSWMVSGMLLELAIKVNGYFIQLEHRYYGETHPTEDLSTENLLYLSSEQALADIAAFTVSMKESLNMPDNKWIAIGGSYAGSLAAWYRLKYPHLVHGALAISAPVLAQVNFLEYMEVVGDSLATSGQECVDAVSEANTNLRELVDEEQSGWDNITRTYKLCDPLDGTNQNDVSNFFEGLAGNIAGVVQYNKDIAGDPYTIDAVCDIMTNETIGSPYLRYAALASFLMGLDQGYCFDISYDEMIKAMQDTDWGYLAAARAWVYQTCTEFGYYQSSDSDFQPFAHEFPVEFITQQCKDIYGEKFTEEFIDESIMKTNTMYGGREPQVTRVVFPNGSIDPWHALSVLKDLNSEAPAIYINGTAHCAIMYPTTADSPPELVQAQDQVLELVQQWLKED